MIAWIIMIVFALFIALVLITTLRRREHRLSMFGVFTVCGIIVGLIMYFEPSWREYWKIVAIIAEAVCILGLAVASGGSDDKSEKPEDGGHPIGCQCYDCVPYEGYRGPGH